MLWFGYNKAIGRMQFQVDVPWIPLLNINYHMGVDGLSVPLVFLTTFLTTLGLYSTFGVIKVRVREFFFLFLVLEMGMLGVFVSLDLVLFYVFWEIGLVPMYFLIGIWGWQSRPQYCRHQVLPLHAGRPVFMLLAILDIYFSDRHVRHAGAARLRPIRGNVGSSAWPSWAFFVAFAIKVPLWPFHTWLPDAHTEAPTAGSVDPGGRPAEAGWLRHAAHPAAHLPRPSRATRGGDRPGGDQHRLRCAGLHGAVGP